MMLIVLATRSLLALAGELFDHLLIPNPRLCSPTALADR